MTRSSPLVLVLALSAAGLWSCEEKKTSSDTPRVEAGAGADKYATADSKLTKALKAAASASANSDGPPPDGIFPPGDADKRHPKGAPTKVDIVSAGSEPRVNFTASADAAPASLTSSYGPAALALLVQLGRGGVAIDFVMALGPARKDDGGADWLIATVGKATPAAEQMGQLAPGAEKDIGTLAGTQIRVKLTPDGRESEVDAQVPKAAPPGLDRFAATVGEALVIGAVPLPSTPVGVDGQWIAESRMPIAGVDTIAYRAYHVKKIDGDRISLTVDMKAYSATSSIPLDGLPQDATLEQADFEARGELEVVRGEVLARKMTEQSRLLLVFKSASAKPPPDQPGQPPGEGMIPVQIQSQATLIRGEDLRAATKRP